MIPAIILPLVRRAILDLMNDVGGEQNEDVLALLLAQLGHRVARRDVASELGWLDVAGLVRAEALGPYTVARLTKDGQDVAEGRLVVEGVGKHKTGE